MPKTKSDIVARAHRVLGLLSLDEAPTADMDEYAGDVLTDVYEQLRSVQDLPLTFALDSVPEAVANPLSDILAAEIAPHYNVQGPMRSRGIMQIRAYLLPDDR